MNYTNLTKTRLKERFFYRKNRIKEEIKDILLKTHKEQESFFTGLLLIAAVGAIACAAVMGGFNIKDEDKIISTICSFGFYICLALVVISITYNSIFHFRKERIEDDEINPESSFYRKGYKQICDKYEVNELESNNAIGYIFTKKLKDDLIYNKLDVSFYQYLYENKALKEEEVNKIKEFLKVNNKSFAEYAQAIDPELLAHILTYYKGEMAKEIDNTVVNFLKEMEEEERRAVEEQNKAKELEKKKNNLFASNSNSLASSMLGKNLAM